MSEALSAAAGRYQIVVVGNAGAVLLDTATGTPWSLARDADTLQLGWRPLEERRSGVALCHASAPSQPLAREHLLPTESVDATSAAWWRPQLASKWSKVRAPRGLGPASRPTTSISAGTDQPWQDNPR